MDTEHDLRPADATPRPYTFRRGLCVYEWDPFSNRYYLIEKRPPHKGVWAVDEGEWHRRKTA
jgi:hypothetical protein